VNIIKY